MSAFPGGVGAQVPAVDTRLAAAGPRCIDCAQIRGTRRFGSTERVEREAEREGIYLVWIPQLGHVDHALLADTLRARAAALRALRRWRARAGARRRRARAPRWAERARRALRSVG